MASVDTGGMRDVVCGMRDVGCGMWDVGCGMWDVGCGLRLGGCAPTWCRLRVESAGNSAETDDYRGCPRNSSNATSLAEGLGWIGLGWGKWWKWKRESGEKVDKSFLKMVILETLRFALRNDSRA